MILMREESEPQANTPCPNCKGLDGEVQGLKAQVAVLTDQIKHLTALLEEARRASKRQAAPFSKGDPKSDPRPPGRKPGDRYGLGAHRPPPPRIDEIVDIPAPPVCESCGGEVEDVSIEKQFLTDIPPVQPKTTLFHVHLGRCRRCGRRAQGRHPRQISSALGVAGNQIGPNAISIACWLNKRAGLSYGKIQQFFHTVFGLDHARATFVRAQIRLTGKSEPTYREMILQIRQSAAVYPDETGWGGAGANAARRGFPSPPASGC